MNNIFLFDIDGTLSVSGNIPNTAVEVLRRINNEDNLILLCTGRNYAQLDENVLNLNLDGAILSNGGYAYIKNEEIYESPMNKDTILSLLNEDCSVTLLSKDSFVYYNGNYKIVRDFCDFFSIKYPVKVDLDYVLNNDFYSLGVYSESDLNYLMDKYSDISLVRVNPSGYDAFNRGVSKASPISRLRELYPNAKIIGFGDNYNDVEMLKAVDVAIVMGSAPDQVKSLADFVTKPALEDGIAYAFEAFLKM